VIEPDKSVTIDNPNAIKALDTARTWVGSISPVGVSTYGEEEARNICRPLPPQMNGARSKPR
jgi:trehalose/maltose transport system substrate-binding protein